MLKEQELKDKVTLGYINDIQPPLDAVMKRYDKVANSHKNPPKFLQDFHELVNQKLEGWMGEAKTPEEQQMVAATFNTLLHNQVANLIKHNPKLAAKIEESRTTLQTSIKLPAPAQVPVEKKKTNKVVAAIRDVGKAGGALFASFFSSQPPKLVEDVSKITEFALDVLFGSAKGIVQKVRAMNTPQDQQQAEAVTVDYQKIKEWTPELAEQAVKNNGNNLKFVPEELVTADLCKAAVESKGEALEHVPLKHKNAEICNKAMEQNPKLAFAFVPDSAKTPEMCERAVVATGENLQHVPKQALSTALCERALKELGKNLAYVPDTLRSASMCHIAIQQDGTSLQFVPNELKTKKLCDEAQSHTTQDLKPFLPQAYAEVKKATPSSTLQAAIAQTQGQQAARQVRQTIVLKQQ
jgi:hypothetical protein